ncbi:MAG: 5-(carboxyamino)imidazole ribonucleotide synthase, partial [Clostridiales bacterium]|nr:5-(carboxyamino)imidazole ribonucleotide synthase [Clostridiales bacterium]
RRPAFGLGIVGGGQLGKMMAVEAIKLGFRVCVMDPQASCPASGLADFFLQADFGDEGAIRRIAGASSAITYEIEHINAKALIRLEEEGFTVYPTGRTLELIQDKLKQKNRLREAGIPVPDFMGAESKEDLAKAAGEFGYPLMVKSRFGGYDGRGNFLLERPLDIEKALSFAPGPKMAERCIDFAMEASVLACRGADGMTAIYPVAQNLHSGSILRQTVAPADLPEETAKRAMHIAELAMSAFSGVGMFCIELFIEKDGRILVNELAPRPHNSGHYTIEACRASQFENHVRAVSGLPLGDPSLMAAAAMVNILGEPGLSGPAQTTGLAEALGVPGASVHIYGKEASVPGRKMGHVTATGKTAAEALHRAEKAASLVKVSAFREGQAGW